MRWRQGVAVPVLILCLTFCGAAALADVDAVAPAHRLTNTGRFLVHLNVATSPEGALPHADAVAKQRHAIGLAKEAVRTALAGRSHRVTREYHSIPFIAVEGGPDVLAVLAPMASTIYPDHLFRVSLPESVPLIRANQAWAQGFDGAGSVVAILDAGVDKLHPFLAGKVTSEACYSANDTCPNGMDTQLGAGAAVPCTFAPASCRHGTHVAGIAAGAGSTFSGVARGAQIMAIQVFSRFTGTACNGTGENPCALAYTSDLIAAMERVYELRTLYRIAAVNLSLGGDVYTSTNQCDADNVPTKAIIDTLRSVGIATVIAAGNDGAPNGISAPACISSAISVGSTTKSDTISTFSNSASFLSVLAPGSSILSSVPGGSFAIFSGTSMAAPHVAGAWAVMKQKSPQASVAVVLDALVTTGVLVTDPRNGITKPRIDVAGAVALIAGQPVSRFTLSISKIGPGLVTSAPAGVACGADCSESYPSDTAVTLSATPDAGYTFMGWSGDPDCTDGSIRMTADKLCTASFLDVTAPIGSVTINRHAAVTTTTGVTLNLTANDAVGVSAYYVSMSSSTPLPSAGGWIAVTSTQNFNANVPFTLTSGEGTKTVYVWYKDVAGNVSSTGNASIIFQTLFSSSALPSIVLEQVATGIAFPVSITHAGDGSGRLFIALQEGKIVIYDGTQALPTAFLDLTALVSCCGERGLLGLAFHPNYLSNGFLYVNYTDAAGNTVIARYKVSGNPNLADPGSALIILTIAQPYSNHNGGQLQFGPDGYLYIGMGDGGSAGDPENRAQNLGELLGKILRLDVNAGSPYAVPPSNPFVGTVGAKPEIWAWGLRNPWRFSFDRLTGDLFIGDVGQSAREEVDLQPATSSGGENYGWRPMEGSACFNPSSGCNDGTLTLPILEYTHASGDCTVIGGYRYRGTQVAGLGGTYIYGDFCTGRIWGATPSGAVWSSVPLLDLPFQISTFGEDQGGELYIAQYAAAGTISRIKSAASPTLTINGSSTPITVAPQATVTVNLQNGPAGWYDVFVLTNASGVDVDWWRFDGTKNSPGPGPSPTATFAATMPATPGSYVFRYFPNVGAPFPLGPTVTVQSAASASLTVNGSSAPITVAPQATVTVNLQNGPAGWYDVFVLTNASGVDVDWWRFDGTKNSPGPEPSPTATFAVTMPATPGSYVFRYFPNVGAPFPLGPTVTVQSAASASLTVNGSSAPITVAPQATVTVNLQNGPAGWYDVFVLTNASGVDVDWWRFDGTKNSPGPEPSPTATFAVTMPATPGSYVFRYFPNVGAPFPLGPTVTVQSAASASLTVNGSSAPITVAPQATVTVNLQNGPAGWYDVFVLTNASGVDVDWWRFDGTKNSPGPGPSPTATFAATMPATPGSYVFRYFPNVGAPFALGPTVTVQ